MTQVLSSVSGTVLEVLVTVGSSVAVDDSVVVIESMKMEIPVAAEQAGVVSEIRVSNGDLVAENQILLILG